MSRKTEHQAEELLRSWAYWHLNSAYLVRGLGYSARTVEGRLVAGEQVGLSGTPHAITPEVHSDPLTRKIATIISAKAETYPRLVFWLYGMPLFVPVDKRMTSLVKRYAQQEQCAERTAWNRRKALLEEVISAARQKK